MKNKLKLIFKFFISKLSLKNIIVMEGINDLDSNTGAFFEYLINNDYNKKYQFIWLLKNYENRKNFNNVKCLNIKKINIFYKIKIARAKFLICDNWFIEKLNDKQKLIYLTHGFPTVKNVKGIINVPKNCDYMLCTSEEFIQLAIEQYGIVSEQIFIDDLPRNDKMLIKNDEMKKINKEQKFSKTIIWMPTFRKTNNSDRNDSDIEYELGIPLINNINEYIKFNEYLKNNNILLIIKFHPGQDMSVVKIKDMSNIKIFSTKRLNDENIDLYELLGNTDALISDYSSVYFDYMLLNKPIGYVVDDIEHYKIGFAYANIYDYMPGLKISNIDDMYEFIDDIINENDKYEKERNLLKTKVHKYEDNKNRERLAKFLKL